MRGKLLITVLSILAISAIGAEERSGTYEVFRDSATGPGDGGGGKL